MAHTLDFLLQPKSVAVIGASNEPSRIGGRPIYSMLTGKYQGRLYPVNPRYETIQGLKAFPSIKDVPEAVDNAIISVPANIAVDILHECAASGVKTAVVFTSGFAEIGDAGVSAQLEISSLSKKSGMRIVGPNCLGVFNLRLGWFGTFANTLASLKIPTGPIGIVTQSGAYGGHLFTISQNRGVGTNYWVTTGNEVDVDVAEVIEYYAKIPDVRVIISYAEGIRDGNRMCKALEAARDAEKPIIFMKVGSTEAGARAAASHTASLAGRDAVYDGLFRQYGVYRAETTEEMADIAYACQFGRYPRGNTIGLQTISGGIGVQLADAATKHGFNVKPLPKKTQKKIHKLIAFAGVNNPVDFTGQVLNERHLLEQSVRYVIEDASYDCQLIYLASLPISPFTKDLSLEIFTSLREAYPDELIIMSLIGPPEARKPYEDIGYPCFEDHSLAVRAMAALRYFGDVFRRGKPDDPPALKKNVLSPLPQALTENKAKIVLSSAGIPIPREILVKSTKEAVAAWRELNSSVVLKVASRDLPHKTEFDGVMLNLNDKSSIKAGYRILINRAKSYNPNAAIDGVLVAEMIPGGVETVLGVFQDPVFGPTVMFGLGGVFIEVLKDVTFRIAPFGLDEARRMINEIRGRAILNGFRGAKASDTEALARTLSNLSVFAANNSDTIHSIEINPFIVLSKGGIAADALIIPKKVDRLLKRHSKH